MFPRGRFSWAVIVIPGDLDLAGQIETEQQNDQNE
jgi:hypothetical protein